MQTFNVVETESHYTLGGPGNYIIRFETDLGYLRFYLKKKEKIIEK